MGLVEDILVFMAHLARSISKEGVEIPSFAEDEGVFGLGLYAHTITPVPRSSHFLRTSSRALGDLEGL